MKTPMADDVKDKLARLLAGKAAGQLPGAAAKQISAGQPIYQRPAEQLGNLRVIYITDGTVSMSSYIDAVQRVIKDVGTHVLSAEQKIEAAAMLFDEHKGSSFTPALIRNLQYATGRRGIVHSDFLQTNEFTSNATTLEQQVAGLVRADIGNGSNDEPYECAAKYLVDLITEDHKTNPNRKYAVVMFGDEQPHGIYGSQACPHGVSPQELRTLATLANRSFWVDCDPHRGEGPFRLGTYEQARDIETATYLKFKDAAPILKEALIGMVEQTKGASAYASFLTQLPAATASSVKGLLGNGKN